MWHTLDRISREFWATRAQIEAERREQDAHELEAHLTHLLLMHAAGCVISEEEQRRDRGKRAKRVERDKRGEYGEQGTLF